MKLPNIRSLFTEAPKVVPEPVTSTGGTWVDPQLALKKVQDLFDIAKDQAEIARAVLSKQRESHLQSISLLQAQVLDHDAHINKLDGVIGDHTTFGGGVVVD